jgi:formylglycine-generating enzyme required for sulfatase activity
MTPADGTATEDTTPTFGWDETAGAAGYEVQLNTTEPELAETIPISISNNSFIPEDSLRNNTVHYWRLRAVNGSGIPTAWSSTFSLTVGEPSASSAKEITAYSFTAAANPALDSTVTGTITGTEISLTVPYGTNVSSLIASFTTTGQSVTVDGNSQFSGTTANDFTDPVTYTVTAADGSTNEYTVTVTVAPNDAKEITAFSFTAAANPALDSTVTGTITGTDISVTVLGGTDVGSLVADFTSTGESVTVNGNPQVSGTTPNDFTDPVTYTVTAEDGSTREYVVVVGDTEVITLSGSGETLTMIYAQNQASITFPTGTDDSGSETLTTRFWLGETEVTNAVMAAVLQWAYDNGRFSSTVGDHNGLDTSTVKHGGQQLLDLDYSDCRVDYDGSGTFSAESGYANNPVTNITWYGAVMFCNWLTEMRDGNTDNVVYTNIDTIWQDDETVEHPERNGYRLPSSDEWEYAARYRGSDSTNTVSGYSNPYFTKGNSASGATADYNNEAACQAVAVYNGQDPSPSDEAAVKSLGPSSANTLGLYDMSGNVWEWCFTENGSSRIKRGSSCYNDANYLQVGYWNFSSPDDESGDLGFRPCRTAD